MKSKKKKELTEDQLDLLVQHIREREGPGTLIIA